MTPRSSRQGPIAAPSPEGPSPIRLGFGANWRQFTLLVVVNAFVGAMVGLERTVVPLIAQADFGLVSKTVVLSFLVSFGIVKALANLFAGQLADRRPSIPASHSPSWALPFRSSPYERPAATRGLSHVSSAPIFPASASAASSCSRPGGTARCSRRARRAWSTT